MLIPGRGFNVLSLRNALPFLRPSVSTHLCDEQTCTTQLESTCFSYLKNLVLERHIMLSYDFAARIHRDHQHPLHEDLSKARSLHNPTRSHFKLSPSSTTAYRTSVFPALSRFPVITYKSYLNTCPLPPFPILPLFYLQSL